MLDVLAASDVSASSSSRALRDEQRPTTLIIFGIVYGEVVGGQRLELVKPRIIAMRLQRDLTVVMIIRRQIWVVVIVARHVRG